MLGNFTYSNPTKLYFGEGALEGLCKELQHYGKNVLLIYGGGSIKKTGVYDAVMGILNDTLNISKWKSEVRVLKKKTVYILKSWI